MNAEQKSRKEHINHMFALMEEVKILISRLRPEDTGHLHTAIGVLNNRVDEIRDQISKP